MSCVWLITMQCRTFSAPSPFLKKKEKKNKKNKGPIHPKKQIKTEQDRTRQNKMN